jgi:hypothetical protein
MAQFTVLWGRITLLTTSPWGKRTTEAWPQLLRAFSIML